MNSTHQDIKMQLDRLEKILDDLYNNADNNLGTNNVVTQRALKSVLYFHALKCDIEAEKKAENVNDGSMTKI